MRREDEFTKKRLSVGKKIVKYFSSEDKRIYYIYNLQKSISSHQRKKKAINDTTSHIVTNDILILALLFKVRKFKFENLSFFQKAVPAGARKWYYRYSSNLFGQVFRKMEYKLELFGFEPTFKVKKESLKTISFVNPSYTSQLCPVSIVNRNKFLPAKNKDRETLLSDVCKTKTKDKNGTFKIDRMGKFFIHKPHSSHDVTNLIDKEVIIDRDAAAALIITYCST